MPGFPESRGCASAISWPLMRTAPFLVTDSGGSQEEAFYLDLPCLVHRKRTERQEGLGENILLSGYRNDVLSSFLDHRRLSDALRSCPPRVAVDVVLDDLARGGGSYAAAAILSANVGTVTHNAAVARFRGTPRPSRRAGARRSSPPSSRFCCWHESLGL